MKESYLAKAINIALDAHKGQSDKSGMPYAGSYHACDESWKNGR